MTKQTTTIQIQNAIKSNLIILEKAEIYNKTTQETETIPNDNFLESFDFLCESNFFTDAIGWHYERNHKTGIYEVESGRMDGDSDVIIAAYFCKNTDVTDEMLKDSLLKIETEEE